MSLLEWAKNEVEIASKRERGDNPEDEFDYGCACYAGALEAFEVLCKQGHSGMSIGFTRNILNRLISVKPLTPIEDTEDVWNVVDRRDGKVMYQCKRMSSLFKTVYEDGKVTYSDNDSCVCVDCETGATYGSGLVRRIYEEMYPVTLPYMPPTYPDKVYCTDLLTDRKNGDFDTVGIFHIVKPNGEKIEVNRFFKEAENGWEEIRIAEYEERMDLDTARREQEVILCV